MGGLNYAGHHRLASETPFKWHFAGVLMMAQHWMLTRQLHDLSGDLHQNCKKPYIFVIFQGGSGPPVPPLDPHMSSMMRYHLQDFSMSEHLQVINLLHISLYQRNFYVTLNWTIIIFIQILTLLFQGMMPHNSHISLGMI